MNDTATVKDNTVTSSVKVHGGGVYLGGNGIFTMNGNATVKGNHANTTGSVSGEGGIGNAEGGGVKVNGTFTMNNNATVAGNTASSNSNSAEGGGVQVDYNSVFILYGGTVYGDYEADASLANTVTTVNGSTGGATVHVGSNGGTAKYGDGSNIPLPDGGGRATDATVSAP
jgi:hypothetical protein